MGSLKKARAVSCVGQLCLARVALHVLVCVSWALRVLLHVLCGSLVLIRVSWASRVSIRVSWASRILFRVSCGSHALIRVLHACPGSVCLEPCTSACDLGRVCVQSRAPAPLADCYLQPSVLAIQRRCPQLARLAE